MKRIILIHVLSGFALAMGVSNGALADQCQVLTRAQADAFSA